MITVCMRSARRLFVCADASHRVAVGFALGMLIGLLPQDNFFSSWLKLNHSIVLGQFMLGCYLIYPTFWICEQLAPGYQARFDRWILRYCWTGWMRGDKLRVQWGLDL